VQESKFPFATFVAFWFSLGAAPLMAVLTCLARIDVRPLRKMVDGRSVFARFVVAFGAALIMIVFMFVPLAPNSHALWRGEAIGLLMENSRIALFAISSSFFLCFYALWISVVFEISNFLAVIRERV
jgi:hypothetical protein